VCDNAAFLSHPLPRCCAVIKLLGAGGMAVVYQVWEESPEIAIALKLIRLDGMSTIKVQHLRDRFRRELRLGMAH
jgi:serine/threonine protein kinase